MKRELGAISGCFMAADQNRNACFPSTRGGNTMLGSFWIAYAVIIALALFAVVLLAREA